LFCSVFLGGNTLIDNFNPNFYDAMSNYQASLRSWKRTHATKVSLVKKLYTTYLVDGLYYQEQPCIPKIIHHIWLGSPLPKKYKKFRKTWMQYHPDWEFVLWTEKEIENFGLQNKDQYEASKNYGQKSDIARYEILYRIGGLYVDTDFVCLQPFDSLHYHLDFYTGLGYSRKFEMYNGLMGSTPGNVILKECIDTLNIRARYQKNPHMNIIYTTGPMHLTRCFIKKSEQAGRVVAFPVNYFYPLPNNQQGKPVNIGDWLRPESIAVHYWETSWCKK
jgi:mannosyltransferase OCH1-like enzyme